MLLSMGLWRGLIEHGGKGCIFGGGKEQWAGGGGVAVSQKGRERERDEIFGRLWSFDISRGYRVRATAKVNGLNFFIGAGVVIRLPLKMILICLIGSKIAPTTSEV